jgi:Cof subfamily protein (haloacid dehalogenase superfamily)
MVVMGKSMDILYEQGLAADDVRTIAGLGEKYGTTITIWSGNKLYANKLNERAVKYSQLSGTTPILLSDLEEVIKEGVSKILWYDEVEQIDRYEKEIETLLSGNVNYHTSQPYFLEFVDRKASKAIAMEKLGEHFGIGREEMIAVGDGFNDLSMIEYAGLGVAMENARDTIKQKADYVTLSNDEDGVAHVINKFVL